MKKLSMGLLQGDRAWIFWFWKILQGSKESKQRSDIPDVYTWPNDPLKFFLNHIQILLFQAFQLTSHKQLEQNNTAENIIEEIMEESDESPPYMPAPSAPSPSQDFVEKSVWFKVQEKDFQHKFLPKKNHWTSIKISSTLRKKRSTKSFRTSKLEINENSQQEKTDQRTFCYERNYISLVFQDICVSRDFLIIWCQNRNKKRKY